MTMSKLTPLNEFREIVNDPSLTDEQLETMRDLVDMQANVILESFLAMKEAEEKKAPNK